jgi:hypothetical protein
MTRITTAALATRVEALETGMAELLQIARGLSPATASPSSEATSQPKPAKTPATTTSSRTKRAKAIAKRKAQNLARGLNPQAQAVCPDGHVGHDGQLRWGIKPSWVCGQTGCGKRKDLDFTTKLPARK